MIIIISIKENQPPVPDNIKQIDFINGRIANLLMFLLSCFAI